MVANHINGFTDVLSVKTVFYPSFVAKKTVQGYPMVGAIATAMDCLFIERSGSSDAKKTAVM